MHDPYTLIADIGPVQLWHRDKNGHDGACGWCYPQLTDRQRQACKDLGFWEGSERHYLRYPYKEYKADYADRVLLYRSLVLLVARVIRVKLTVDEAEAFVAEKFAVGGCEGPDGLFCFVAGYHSNYPEDRDQDRAEHWSRQCASVAREILRRKRPWFRHPRWHVHHWRINVPAFRRWFGWNWM